MNRTIYFCCDNDGKQVVGLGYTPDQTVHSLGYSAANFLGPQILAHEDANTQLFERRAVDK